MCHSFLLLPNFLVFQTPSSNSSANCLSHLPLYFPLFRAGFNIFLLFIATFTHPLMSQTDFLRFLCVTQGLSTPHQAQTRLPQFLGNTGLGSWTSNSTRFLPRSLPPSHFPCRCLKGCARGGRAERDKRHRLEGRAALSLWQLHLLVLAETPWFKLFQTQMDKCKQPKGTFTYYKFTLSTILLFLPSPAAVPECSSTCPWFLPTSGFCCPMEEGRFWLIQTGQYKQNKAPPFFKRS